MPNVTFYLLIAEKYNAEQFACRLVDKAWRQGHVIHLHLRDEQHCSTMDQLLWQWREDSFIPHSIAGTTTEHADSPVTLGYRSPGLTHSQLVINLADDSPDFLHRFSRICEIVTQTPERLALSREKFKHYRQAGLQPDVHKFT